MWAMHSSAITVSIHLSVRAHVHLLRLFRACSHARAVRGLTWESSLFSKWRSGGKSGMRRRALFLPLLYLKACLQTLFFGIYWACLLLGST